MILSQNEFFLSRCVWNYFSSLQFIFWNFSFPGKSKTPVLSHKILMVASLLFRSVKLSCTFHIFFCSVVLLYFPGNAVWVGFLRLLPGAQSCVGVGAATRPPCLLQTDLIHTDSRRNVSKWMMQKSTFSIFPPPSLPPSLPSFLLHFSFFFTLYDFIYRKLQKMKTSL